MKKAAFIISVLLVILAIFLSCNRQMIPFEVQKGKVKVYDSATFERYFVEAIKLKLFGNSSDALSLLEQCLIINPGSDAVCFQMAQILIALGDENNAKKYALKAYELDPKNFWYFMMLAGTYYKEHNIDSAIIFYDKASKAFPEKENLLLTLGNLYSENKNYEKADAILEALDKKYGINEGSTVSTVKNLMRGEKYNEALEKARILVEKYPDEILYKGLLAEIYRGLGDAEKAMKIYQDLLDKDPDNPETLLSLCDFLINEKKYDDLMLLVNKVAINDNVSRGDKISLFTRLIETEELTEKYGNKLDISLRVLEAAYINDDIIQLLRPELYIAQNKLTKAGERLEEIINKNENNYYAWEKLLLVYLQEGNYGKLMEKGEECASKFNRSFLAKLLYATAASENGKYDIAIDELRKATILAGNNKDMMLQVLTQKADVYYRMKDYVKAFKTFDEALKNNNNDLTVLNNYAYYLAERNTRLKEAEEMAKRVIEKEKTNSTFLDTYAWILYKRGKIKEAEKIMEGIIRKEIEPDAEYYEHYGYILKKKKDCKNAVINWNIALKIDSTKKELIKEIQDCQERY
jgi:tetratricopeptide (TPR) repeat protein